MYQLGICYFLGNRFPEARETFYDVEKRKAGMGSFYLAKTEMKLHHQELAIKYLKDHLSSRYKVPEKQILLDPDLSLLEGTEQWQELWNEKEWYSQSDKDFQEALFMKDHGKELEAINLLIKLEKQGYEKSRVLAEKAGIYTMLENKKAALSAYRSSLKADVRNLDALFRMSEMLLEEGDTEEALEGLNRLIRQEPDRFEAYLLRARARSETGDLSGALEDLDTYITYFPDHPEAYYQKGKIQHVHGRYLDAIKSYNHALELDRGNADYFFARGMTYKATGTLRPAEKDMSMALDLDPLNGSIWFEKAKISQELGDSEDACFCYRKAFQYGVYEAGEIVEKLCK
jgi:tetratricopeptide (TPR) repeat protein